MRVPDCRFSVISRIRSRWEETNADQGFSLIELLTVAIIIGILAAIAIPMFMSDKAKAGDATAQSDVRNLATLEESYVADDTAATYGSATDLASSGTSLPASKGDSVWVFTQGSRGYCLVGHHAQSADYVVWDSEHGGLQTTKYATLASAQGVCTSAGYTAAGTITNTDGTVQTG